MVNVVGIVLVAFLGLQSARGEVEDKSKSRQIPDRGPALGAIAKAERVRDKATELRRRKRIFELR